MSEHHQLIIIGAGPAGFTAGIYGSRANLDTVIFEGPQPGGQLTITTDVENFPGFEEGISGPELMEKFRKQANRFGAKSIHEIINKVDFSQKPFQLWSDRNNHYTADAVIIATGATARLLKDTKGHAAYWGRGISACATCDGFFYRGKKIFVVGGGDTAMEEAEYLTHFGESVTIIHRRQEFRASKIMVERVKSNPKIRFMLDSVIDEFIGETKMGFPSLTSINIKNIKENEITNHPADGVFIAIGHVPNTEIFKDILEMDGDGYLITKKGTTYTNIPGVFACGDVQDRVYRQAVSAAGTGCAAAIETDRWLAEQK